MSTQGVSLDVKKLVFNSVQDIEAALNAKKITDAQANFLKTFFPEQEKDLKKGVAVEHGENEKLSKEQKQEKEKARQKELAEIENAKAHVKKDGVKTEEGVITSHGDGTTYTFDIKAPTKHKEKTTKDAERARMARYYDEKSGEWIERGDKYKTNKEVRKALKAKEKEIEAEQKQAKKDAKNLNKEARAAGAEAAKYDAEMEKLIASSGLSKEQIMQDPKYAELTKNWSSAMAKYSELESKSNDAIDKQMKAKEELEQVHQARVASGRTGFLKKTGVGADKRAYNNNVEASNRLADRVVVRTDAEKDRIKDSPEYKGKEIKVASDEDIQLLKRLSVTARRYMDEASDPKEKSVWQELANLTTKDEHGRIFFNANTKQVQDALIDITGGDMRLNYTEQKILSKETGMSMAEVRHAFKTYGFEAPNPIGKRIVNGLVAAGPVAATMGLSYILSKKKAGAEAYSEQTAQDDAVSDAHQTSVVEGSVTASVPGYRIHEVLPTGEEYNKVIAGKSVTEYYKAVAEANAHAEAHSKAFASATAACEAVAKLSPLALTAAPVLAFLAGAAKTPVEISATQAGVTTEKMSKFVNVFKHNKNKNIGNQIIQMAGQITGDKAVDRALIVAVLENDIGSQNTTPTTRELRNTLAHLEAIKGEVDKFKKLPPAPTPTEAPTEASTEAPKKEYHADGNNTYTVEKNDILGNIVRAKYPGVNPLKAMEAIKKANGLIDINSLRIGQVLELPEVDGAKPSDTSAKKHIGGRRIKYRPTRTDAQAKGSVYEGKAHEGSHDKEKVIKTFTGKDAKKRAQEEANRLNNQQK